MDELKKKETQSAQTGDATAGAEVPAAKADQTEAPAAPAGGKWPNWSEARAPQMPDAGYSSPYDQQLQDLYKSITERKPFEYNASDDAMYQQYKDRYMQLGQEAMRDTMGQAAALTGGYGSSYGQAVGQQQYDQYMLGLNDKASELYAQAYQRYKDEGDREPMGLHAFKLSFWHPFRAVPIEITAQVPAWADKIHKKDIEIG